MTRFADAGPPGTWLRMMRTAVEAGCAGAATLEAAAQGTVKAIYEQFQESMVLVRLFVTIPFAGLPPEVQAAANEMAASAAQATAGHTPVLTLLGTYGDEESWRDRRRSRGHVGIPLVSSTFISAIPMLARLLEELGVDIEWFDSADLKTFVEAGLFKSGSFHVSDATSVVDARGRKVIAAQEFVQRHGVQTVFGAGAAFLGTPNMSALICFTREPLEPEVSQAALTAVSQFRAMTQGLVNAGKLIGS